MRRRRLPPRPEQPPEGMVWRRSRGKDILISAEYAQVYSQAVMDGRIMTDSPHWRNDPTYNIRRKRRTEP